MVINPSILRGDLYWLADVLDWWRGRHIHPHRLHRHVLKARDRLIRRDEINLVLTWGTCTMWGFWVTGTGTL